MEAENAPDLADNGRKTACGGVGEGRGRRRQALQAARGAEAAPLAHEKPEVEGGRVNQYPFSDLLLPADVDAAQPAAHEQMPNIRSSLSPRRRSSRFPRLPRIRRRLPYTAFCASRFPFHFRRPRFGSLT